MRHWYLYVYIRKGFLVTEMLDNMFLFKRIFHYFQNENFYLNHFHGRNFGISWQIYTNYTKVLKKKL